MRLPSTDDKLFIGADDWWMNACLDWYHDPSELYIVGYKEAADSLVETIACCKGTADTLFFLSFFFIVNILSLGSNPYYKTDAAC